MFMKKLEGSTFCLSLDVPGSLICSIPPPALPKALLRPKVRGAAERFSTVNTWIGA